MPASESSNNMTNSPSYRLGRPRKTDSYTITPCAIVQEENTAVSAPSGAVQTQTATPPPTPRSPDSSQLLAPRPKYLPRYGYFSSPPSQPPSAKRRAINAGTSQRVFGYITPVSTQTPTPAPSPGTRPTFAASSKPRVTQATGADSLSKPQPPISSVLPTPSNAPDSSHRPQPTDYQDLLQRSCAAVNRCKENMQHIASRWATPPRAVATAALSAVIIIGSGRNVQNIRITDDFLMAKIREIDELARASTTTDSWAFCKKYMCIATLLRIMWETAREEMTWDYLARVLDMYEFALCEDEGLGNEKGRVWVLAYKGNVGPRQISEKGLMA